MLEKIRQIILEIFFPVTCLDCGQDGEWLCEQCFNNLKLDNNFLETVDFKPSFLDGFFVAANWQDKILQKVIHSYKYNFSQELSLILARLLLIKTKHLLKIYPEIQNFILMPVPLHKKRLTWRGFNQAELLVNVLAQKLNMKTEDGFLKRIKNTQAQAKLNSKKRAKNIVNAFVVSKDVRGQEILLVDDVITTGATMNECAKVLKQAGAKTVYGLTVARG
ncbi:MAG TPA: ComF family protein [bacterium]|nr:ComF family protein [bacterium]